MLKVSYPPGIDDDLWWEPLGDSEIAERLRDIHDIEWAEGLENSDCHWLVTSHDGFAEHVIDRPTLIHSHQDSFTPNLKSRNKVAASDCQHIRGIVCPALWTDRWRHNCIGDGFDHLSMHFGAPIWRAFTKLEDWVMLYAFDPLPWSQYLRFGPIYETTSDMKPTKRAMFWGWTKYDFDGRTYFAEHHRKRLLDKLNPKWDSLHAAPPRRQMCDFFAAMLDARCCIQPFGWNPSSARSISVMFSGTPSVWPQCPDITWSINPFAAAVRCRPDWFDLDDVIASCDATAVHERTHAARAEYITQVRNLDALADQLAGILIAAFGYP